mmetsp:Transcript_19523/g.22183  ORF Transcript_19523/g.22183 Transcript_19523/m.22183 type:complete len:326 (-) Transcript_19523:357-1334(-)
MEGQFLERLNKIVISSEKTKVDQTLSTTLSTEHAKNCIEKIEQDQLVSLPEVETHEMTDISLASGTNTWHLDRVNQRVAVLDGDSRQNTESTNTVHVYIIDSGVDRYHPYLSAKCPASDSEHYDALDPDDDPCDFYACDSNSHGTHVSGLVAASHYGYNPNATIHAVKVFDETGTTSISTIITGINWVLQHDSQTSFTNTTRTFPAVVNMSLGGSHSDTFNDATKSLYDQGIVTVVAAGNESTDACDKSPASLAQALTVGAIEEGDARAYFSNYGDCVDVYAPGLAIWSTIPDYMLGSKSGTSMASPIVAGIASAVMADSLDGAL